MIEDYVVTNEHASGHISLQQPEMILTVKFITVSFRYKVTMHCKTVKSDLGLDQTVVISQMFLILNIIKKLNFLICCFFIEHFFNGVSFSVD